MPTRSKQLALGGAGPGTYDIYTVPSTSTTIVKEILLQNESNNPNAVSFTLFRAGAGVYLRLLYAYSVPTLTTFEMARWTVMEAGDYLEISFGTGVFRWCVSGAELVD